MSGDPGKLPAREDWPRYTMTVVRKDGTKSSSVDLSNKEVCSICDGLRDGTLHAVVTGDLRRGTVIPWAEVSSVHFQMQEREGAAASDPVLEAARKVVQNWCDANRSPADFHNALDHLERTLAEVAP